MKSKTTSILLAAAVLLPAGLTARQLSPDAALDAAMARSTAHAPARDRGAYELAETLSADGLNTVYAFNAPRGGFVLVAADDVASPVLGYSDNGVFDPDNMPENLLGWLEGVSTMIADAAKTGGHVVAGAPVAGASDVAPLVTTRWNQDSPYNEQCPKVNGKYCMTGCVATAIAQVVNYHRWPEAYGIGTVSYEWNNPPVLLSYNFTKNRFDWDNMLDSYDSSATAAQKSAVAQLMKACGVAAQMNYDTSASGAPNTYLAPALIENFNYDKALRVCQRAFYEPAEWCLLIYNELAASRPVYMTGANSSVGHAFVVDGYSAADGFYHVNWGWGGMSDGYYAITSMNPDDQGIGGSSAGYAQSQQIFVGLREPVAGSNYYPEFTIAAGFGTVHPSYTRSENVDILTTDGGIFNSSLVDMDVELGVCLTDNGGNKQYVWWAYGPVNVPVGAGYNTYQIPASSFPDSGTYRMTPVVRYDGRIADVHVETSYPRYATVTCSPEKLEFSSPEYKYNLRLDEVLPVGKLYKGTVGSFVARITNTGNAEFYNKTMAAGFFYGNTTVSFSAVADIPAGETVDVVFTGRISSAVPAGKYGLLIQYKEGYNTVDMPTGDAQIEIFDAPEGPTVLNLNSIDMHDALSGTGSQLRPYVLPMGPVNATIEIGCTSGLFDGYVNALLHTADNNSAQLGWTYKALSTIAEGDTRSYTFSVPFDDASAITPGTVYLMTFFPGTISGGYMENGSFDNGGTVYVKFQDPAGIADATGAAGETRVWPVPATDLVNIEAPAAITSVEVYSLSGSCVARGAYDGAESVVTLDVARLSPGVYPARIITSTGVYTVKIIKK